MEYIICQAESKGSLIVSEFTGVSATLSKAVKVNPWDLGVSPFHHSSSINLTDNPNLFQLGSSTSD